MWFDSKVILVWKNETNNYPTTNNRKAAKKKYYSDKDIIKPNTKCALFIRDMPFLLHLLCKPPNT